MNLSIAFLPLFSSIALVLSQLAVGAVLTLASSAMSAKYSKDPRITPAAEPPIFAAIGQRRVEEQAPHCRYCGAVSHNHRCDGCGAPRMGDEIPHMAERT